MDEPRIYKKVNSGNFENDLAKLEKAHYRKDKKSRNEFNCLIEFYLNQITKEPYCKELIHLGVRAFIANEPLPVNVESNGFAFRKIRFSMPGLVKLARYGRLIYVVNDTHLLIFPISIYTHIEYPKRPPNKDLKREFSFINEYMNENLDKVR